MLYPRPQGGTQVLDKPPDGTLDPLYTSPNPQEVGKELEKAKSSLTIVENPSLDGLLVILMGATTVLSGGRTGFIGAYVITADKDFKYHGMDKYQYAAIEESSDPESPHTLLLGVEGKKHPAGSIHPYKVCKISKEEFDKFEAAITAYENPDDESPEDVTELDKDDEYDDENLDDLVKNMVKLVVKEFPDEFSIDEDGNLVLPGNYANTRIRGR